MRKVLPIAYAAFIVLIILLADMGRLPLQVLSVIPHYDWLAHFILYALFCIIIYRAMHNKGYVLWILLPLIVLEEISQLFFIHRTFSFIDLMMGVLGAMLGFLIMSKRVARMKGTLLIADR